MQKYNIVTIGCQMNKSDSERIAGFLENHGFEWIDDKYRADLVVFVTCGVRKSAEDRIYGLIPGIKLANPACTIIVTGCLSQRKDIKSKIGKYTDEFMPINEFFNFKLPFFKQSKNSKLKIKNYSSKTDNNYLCTPPKHSSKSSAYVPIGNGCNNFCSYCVVPYARGREVYRPACEIINEVASLVKRGYREIMLIAQNVNSYNGQIPNVKKQGMKEINFAGLLKIINNIPGDFWIRFATSHPKDMGDELIEAIASCEKVCKHVHLPAQSGDDGILEAMNRKYTIKHYEDLITRIRTHIINAQTAACKIQPAEKNAWRPPAAITTDIIVGFPGESKLQFENTKRLFKHVKYDMAYIAQYSSGRKQKRKSWLMTSRQMKKSGAKRIWIKY